MSSNFIINVLNPTNNQDVATKSYTDTQDNLKVNKAGDVMSGTLTINNSAFINGQPNLGQDGVRVHHSAGTDRSGYIDCRGNQFVIRQKTDGLGDTIRLTINDTDTTLYQPLNMNNNRITNLLTATNDYEAVNKYYIDNTILKLPITIPISNTYTINSVDRCIVCNLSGSHLVYLDSLLSSRGRMLYIKNMSATMDTLVIYPPAGGSIDHYTTGRRIGSRHSVLLVADNNIDITKKWLP